MRVFSAILLVIILAITVWLGPKACVILVGVCGAIVVDEFFVNFLKKNRSSAYIVTQIIYLIGYIALYSFADVLTNPLLILSIFYNLVLIGYLFYYDNGSQLINKLLLQFPFLISFFVLIPVGVIGGLFQLNNWKVVLIGMMVINFGMDTGAWFFGKNFGKRKLWPAVSPKKTVEGLIGGMFFSAIIGIIFWSYFIGPTSVGLFIFLLFLALSSQLGDLVQSKIKRYFSVKDSSALIPGHGGVYDRIDSLLFSAPFFIFVLRNYYNV